MGLLKLADGAELISELVIQHPHEDMEWRQASFLSPEKMADLTAFQHHSELHDAAAVVRKALGQLHKTRLKLCPALIQMKSNEGRGEAGEEGGGALGVSGSATTAGRFNVSRAASASVAIACAWLKQGGVLTSPSPRPSQSSARPSGMLLRRWDSFGSGDSQISDVEPILRCVSSGGVRVRHCLTQNPSHAYVSRKVRAHDCVHVCSLVVYACDCSPRACVIEPYNAFVSLG